MIKELKKRLSLLIILCIGMVLSMITLKIVTAKDEYIEVEMLSTAGDWWYSDQQAPSWLADSLMVGDKERNIQGKTSAEILDLHSYQDGSRKIVSLRVKLLVTKNKITGKYLFRQQTLEIGSFISLSLSTTKFNGSVVSINGVRNESEIIPKTIKVRIYYMRPWLAEYIRIGDKSQESSNPDIEILDKTIALAEMTVATDKGDVFLRRDPRFRDVSLTLRVKASQRNGISYYAYYQPLKVGNIVYFPMEKYNLYEAHILTID